MWQLQSVLLVGVAFICHRFHFKSHLNQLYRSKEIKCFSHKGECGLPVHVSRCLEEDLAWAIDKWFRLVSNVT